MSTLDQVVAGMCKETDNSTLGWDVVVNYSATEINALLKAAYDRGHQGQLTTIPTIRIEGENEDGTQYNMDFDFNLGPPLIQFKDPGIVSACSLTIPVIGGSVKTSKNQWTIDPGAYSVELSGVSLAHVTGTRGNRKLTPSHEPAVLNSPNMTGAVTLDLATSISQEWLKVKLVASKGGIRLIDGRLEHLAVKILSFFSTSPNLINWDLAHIKNTLPSGKTGTNLVPKSFRFAVYCPNENDSNYTILSLFIETNGGKRGTEKQLQQNWSAKWSDTKYGVPPIPQSYTASVIFNNAWIKDLVEKSVRDQGLKIEEIEKTSHDTWGIKWKITTGKKFTIQKVSERTGVIYNAMDGVSVDLDKEAQGLYMTLGQNGGSNVQANALLEWEFSFTTGWLKQVSTGVPRVPPYITHGKVIATNKLNIKKYVDNSALPNYKVSLDASFTKNDWNAPHLVPGTSDQHWWDFGRRLIVPKFVANQPELPSLNFKLFDIGFFMTTNLLLPNQKVINFGTTPGARIPRDLYLVGQIVDP